MLSLFRCGLLRCSLAGLALALATDCLGVEELYKAWLKDERLASRITVTRAGKVVPYTIGLRACDVVMRTDANKQDGDQVEVIIVTLGGLRIRLMGARAYTVPCDDSGVVTSVLVFLKGVRERADETYASIVAAGRGKCDAASSDLDMPIVPRPTVPSTITVSSHPLALRWFGRFSPFRVEVRRVTDGKEGERLLEVSGISGSSLSAAVPNFAVGAYTITLSDACGAVVKEHDLRVVSVDQRPPLPPLLRSAALSEIDRTIWYANYLLAQGGGPWQLEAMQLIAALPQQEDPRIRDWLAAWGGH
jgi:hypothetical protein